jgi:REP element-mobilizing transposase RayT
VEGFSTCYVDTYQAFGPIECIILSAHILCNHAHSRRKIALSDGSYDGTLDRGPSSLYASGKITVHDFVIMPNHVHILMTLPGEISIEKAMQLIKGSFSFRASKELGFRGEIWQRGFSDVRVLDDKSLQQHREYIENNPVKAGLANRPDEYPFGTAYLKKQKHAGAKAQGLLEASIGTTEVVP